MSVGEKIIGFMVGIVLTAMAGALVFVLLQGLKIVILSVGEGATREWFMLSWAMLPLAYILGQGFLEYRKETKVKVKKDE